jgi:hypothetical protein
MRQRSFTSRTMLLSRVPGGMLDSQCLTGSGWPGGHSAISHTSGGDVPIGLPDADGQEL